MRVLRQETLFSRGPISTDADWAFARTLLISAIQEVVWPEGSTTFRIYPESGKKRGEGNGVKPIKLGLMRRLLQLGWKLEQPFGIEPGRKPGKIDAVFDARLGRIALEWETGNISSSHRALNKMALALSRGLLVGGILVLPSRTLYQFLTDRVGNYQEIEPYFDLWRSLPYQGFLEVIEVEHDAIDPSVPRIPKGTDGRALS